MEQGNYGYGLQVEAMDAIERENEELKDVLSSVQVDLEQRTEVY